MKKLLIVSTCGTSSLTNGASPSLRAQLMQYANAADAAQIPPDALGAIDAHLSERRVAFPSLSHAEVARASAEINGLLANQALAPAATHTEHILLASDTYLGGQTASLVESWLRAQGANVQSLSFPGLRTDDLESFRAAISELVRWAAGSDLQGYREAGYHVIFNLTGGFKSVNGFMQSLGSLFADEVIYLFEGGQLLRIPRLPVSLAIEPIVRAHLTAFRRMAELKEVLTAQACADIPETLLEIVDDQRVLSVWGEASWAQLQPSLYDEAFYPSPSPLVIYSEPFERDALSHQNRWRTLNTRIDDLCRYALARQQRVSDDANLARLDFKPLKGGPHKGSTHECDAWAKHGGFRIFCHLDGDHIILDRLTDGLH